MCSLSPSPFLPLHSLSPPHTRRTSTARSIAPRLRGLSRCLSTRTRAGHEPIEPLGRGALLPPSTWRPGSGRESGSSASKATSVATAAAGGSAAAAAAGEEEEEETSTLAPPPSQRATAAASASAASAATTCIALPPLLLFLDSGALDASGFLAARGVREDDEAVTLTRLLGPGEAPKASILLGEDAMVAELKFFPGRTRGEDARKVSVFRKKHLDGAENKKQETKKDRTSSVSRL